MNITYILLSPTFGMHQYTADLANRAAAPGNWKPEAESASPRPPASSFQPPASGDRQSMVRMVTTATLPRDRYSPAVPIETPITTHGTGFSREGLDLAAYRRARDAIFHLPCSIFHLPSSIFLQSSVFHFTGVHLWNVPLVYALRRRGLTVVHTLHDLDPHHGVRFGGLIRLWNRLIIASGCHLLVHGACYRDRLIAQGVPAGRITYTPLLHGFLSAAHPWPPQMPPATGHPPPATFTVLFFGRVEAYKGVDILLAAWSFLTKELRDNSCNGWPESRLIIAGPAAPGVALPPLPPGAELRDRRILDAEADALFRAADLLVLPYRDATQSALIAAAYAYGLPVIVTRTGALPEYVVEGETGWVVPAEDPTALARALRDALADPDRTRRMGAAGRAWFEAQRCAEETMLSAMYRQLTDNRLPG